MRGDMVFQVFGVHKGRPKDVYFGSFRSREEAQTKIGQLEVMTMDGLNWAERHHNNGFVIREKIVNTDFEIPPVPKPRDKYFVTGSPKPNRPGTWDSTQVQVFRRGHSVEQNELVCEYARNYAMLQTFEPFRQRSRDFALISRSYTKTAVLDLASGAIIAEEDEPGLPGSGFCPVGFYVPDWWDVHHGDVIPGSEYWTADHEWPVGDFGFVWGCYWGDDSSWKVQYLDLSRVREGVIRRDERFGYVELATAGHTLPGAESGGDPSTKGNPPSFIRLFRHGGESKITFAVEMVFDLESGRAREWERLRIENFE